MTTRAWTTGELQVLKTYASLGASTVAALLERSISSVEHKAREVRISLEVTREDIDVTSASARLLAKVREIPGLAICPLCAKRFATMKSTGMCRSCHLEQLIALREEQLAEEIRLRTLTKLRQDKHRLRICDECNRAFFPRANSSTAICGECGGE